jgi:hypothetical protein
MSLGIITGQGFEAIMTTHDCWRCGKDWHCDQTAYNLSHHSGCDECSAKDVWMRAEVPRHSPAPLNRVSEAAQHGAR